MGSVLIIEDDESVQRMLKLTFEQAGYDVGVASNGRIGIQLYQATPFDLVITDLIMPEMEGLETIAALNQSDPKVKVIAISGGGCSEPQSYLKIAAKMGAARAFSKPVDRHELLAAVKDLLANPS